MTDLFSAETPPIEEFFGVYRFLSNFYPAPVYFEAVRYESAEHAYVAAKTTDPEIREKIRQIFTPGRVKRYGRQIALREDWDRIKVDAMLTIVRSKFSYPELAAMLKATGQRQLIEGNTWNDTFWGVCNGKGDNVLGKILMQVRSEI